MSPRSNARVLIYSHDTYGLGHFRRSTLIARSLLAGSGFGDVLIATGSPRSRSFDLPDGCDVLELPAVTKAPDGSYRSRSLRLPLAEILDLRCRLVETAVAAFRPDLVLVDHAPVGVVRELAPLLDALEGRPDRPRLVLGLRDVIDAAPVVDRDWRILDAWRYIDRLYDGVIVYGDPRVTTTAQELGLPARLGDRLHFTGYLARRSDEAAPAASPPRILVTAGGGGDGQRLLRAYARFLEGQRTRLPFVSHVVLGPFLSTGRRRELTRRFEAIDQPIELSGFVPGLEHEIARARGVVTMGGYNSMMEILGAGTPALVYPRTVPRIEQRLRVERLAHHAPIEVCTSDRGLPRRLEVFVQRALAAPLQRPPTPLDLDGTRRIGAVLRRILARDRVQSAEETRSRVC